MAEYESHQYDVIVIGAGGAGLRAAVEAQAARAAGGAGLQVAARQGPHGDGRGRRRRGDGQRVLGGQLAGPLPRHDARRQDAEQLADGPAARPGGAGAGPRARELGRAVRPDQGRPDDPAGLRRPPLRPAGPRRRPHRPGDHPDAAAEGRLDGHRRLHGVQGPPPAGRRRRPHLRRRRLLAADRRVRHVHRQGRRAGHRVDRQELDVHLQLLGVDRRRSRHGHLGRRRRDRDGVRPVPPDRDGLAAVGARPARHRGRARRRRRAAQQRGRAVHVRLRRPDVPGGDGRDRRGGRPLVRRPHQQPADPRPAAP